MWRFEHLLIAAVRFVRDGMRRRSVVRPTAVGAYTPDMGECREEGFLWALLFALPMPSWDGVGETFITQSNTHESE